MKTTATFKIDGSFIITGRGLVIFGDIVDGKINLEDYLSFNDGTGMTKLKIAGVDFLDRMGSDNISKVGLTFFYISDKQRMDLEALKVTDQTAIITDQ